LLLVRVTTAPPDGAGPVKLTVPVEEVPPVTEAGFKLTELRAAAVSVKVAVFVTPWVPEIVTEALDATADVVIVKVAVVAPVATVTLAGKCAAEVLLLVRVTTAPPDGAGPVKLTVPVEDVPPTTETGFKPTELRTGVVTVKPTVCVEPRVAEIVRGALATTGLVVTVNVAVVAPALTLTEAATWAAAVLLLKRATTAPLAGAGALSVTVPVDEAPPITEEGLRTTEVTAREPKLNADWLAPLMVMLWFGGVKT
jgi:hypothetical protein